MSRKGATYLWIALAISSLANILLAVQLHTRQPATVVVVCHAPSEDSTPVDCNYQGDTDSWVPRQATR